MKNEDFKKILMEWKTKELPLIKKRELSVNLNPTQIVTITGIRRCGKTFFLLWIAKNLLKKFDREEILYINFEHELLTGLSSRDLRKLFKSHRELFTKDVKYLLLDELPKVKEWDIWLRRVFDEKKYRIFITGSSYDLRPEELSYALRGRTINYMLFPLSFKEFLKFRELKFNEKELILEEKRGELLKELRVYLEFGGFPDVVMKDDDFEKIKLISSYFDTIILRDIVEKHEIRNVRILRNFLKYVISISSNYFSGSKTEKYFRSIGEKVSKPTILDFYEYAKRAFLLLPIEIFSTKAKLRFQSPVKTYVMDTGFINYINPRFSENWGALMENVVAVQLHRLKESNPRVELFYWKEYGKQEGKEVDFVIKEGLKVKRLIQVTYASDFDEMERRELRALVKASELLKCKDLVVISWDLEDEVEFSGKKIKVIPLWKWLLG
ncbi:MAG: ATP-binding protein [Candidatus Aenigmarchaeota archaeon]|nr:ATP-binding protein [Candidatus Aenigmarchaeota archaeon]